MFSLTLSQRLEVKPQLKLVLALYPILRQYDEYWNKRPKHKWTIPKELLSGDYDEIKAVLPQYNGQGRVEFLADVMGGAVLFTDAGKVRGLLGIVTRDIPLTIKENGLEYTTALTPTYGLVHKAPKMEWRGAINHVCLTRGPIPGEKLDGKVAATLAPATLMSDSSLRKTICPFLFTDFEVKDKKIRENFRKVTAARQVGSLLRGQKGEKQLMSLVSEYLGVTDQYEEWTKEVSRKTPFADLKELQEKYKEIKLKNYL